MRIEIIAIASIIIFVVLLSVFIEVPRMDEDIMKLQNYGKAPELAGITGWINTEPFKLTDLRGKVVIIDFWTYSCINCIRTLPYLNSWHEKYAEKGLVIVGVHTPEFEFEKDYSNVLQAVEKFGVKYKVVQDNDYATWRAYGNRYWPRKYLIDAEGNIRYDHIGEGGYDETEKVIIQLLKERNVSVDEKNMTKLPQDVNFTNIGTPELYLGYAFARAPLGNPEGFSADEIVDYKPTDIKIENIIYLEGKWKNNPDHVESVENSKMTLRYQAKNVNAVMSGSGTATIFLDDELIGDNGGKDVTDNKVTISESRLYNIVSTSAYGKHKVQIVAELGIEIYAFTFG